MIAELARSLKQDGRQVRVVERGPQPAAQEWAELARSVPWLSFEHVQDPRLTAFETQIVGATPHGLITFVGAIEGEQWRPLGALLSALSTGELAWDGTHTQEALQQLDRSVDLEIFVSPQCPFCATVSAAVLRFAAASAAVSLRIIRADSLTLPQGLHTLPTVRADGVVVAEGAVEESTLVRQISAYQRSVPPTSTLMPISRPRDFPSGVRSAVPAPKGHPARSPRQGSTAA